MVSKTSDVHPIPLHQYYATLSPAPPVIDITGWKLPAPKPNVMTAAFGRENKSVTLPTSVIVYCPATGIPEPKIRVEKRVGEMLVPVNKAQLANLSDGSPGRLFSILPFMEEDAGEYVCIAESIAGIDRKWISLKVASE